MCRHRSLRQIINFHVLLCVVIPGHLLLIVAGVDFLESLILFGWLLITNLAMVWLKLFVRLIGHSIITLLKLLDLPMSLHLHFLQFPPLNLLSFKLGLTLLALLSLFRLFSLLQKLFHPDKVRFSLEILFDICSFPFNRDSIFHFCPGFVFHNSLFEVSLNFFLPRQHLVSVFGFPFHFFHVNEGNELVAVVRADN